MKRKLYKASLAVLVQKNWEIEVEAKNEQEASKKAIDCFEDDVDLGELVDFSGAEIELDLLSPEKPNSGCGIWVEEVK